MEKRHGGDKVDKGSYLDNEIILPGSPRHLYLKIGILIAVIVVLAVSLIYVMALPFIGLGLIVLALPFWVFFYLCQNVSCHLLKMRCAVNSWLCEVTHKYLCERCGKNCESKEDRVVMMTKAVFLTIGAIVLLVIGHYL